MIAVILLGYAAVPFLSITQRPKNCIFSFSYKHLSLFKAIPTDMICVSVASSLTSCSSLFFPKSTHCQFRTLFQLVHLKFWKLSLGPGLSCLYNFEHNRSLKALSISIEHLNENVCDNYSNQAITWYKTRHRFTPERNIDHNT